MPNPVPWLSGGLFLYCGHVCIQAGPRCLPHLSLADRTMGRCLAEEAQWSLLKNFTPRADALLLHQSFIAFFFLNLSPHSQVLTKHNWRNNDSCGQLSKEAVYFMKLMTQFKYNHRTTLRQKGLREIKHFFKKMAGLTLTAPMIRQLMLVKGFSWAGHFIASIALFRTVYESWHTYFYFL